MMRYLYLLLIATAFTGCSTIIKGTRDASVMFVPNVTPDRVVLKNERTGAEQEITISDTMFIDLSSRYKYFKRNKFEIAFFKSGFPPFKISLVPGVTFWYWLNIPLGCIWMVTIDPATGAMYQYKQRKYEVTF